MDERDVRLNFKVRVVALDGRCILHPFADECEGDLQAHHVVTQQQLRKADRHDLLWDPNNGATVCEKAHRRHTLAVERLPRYLLPSRCIEFARKHGFEGILSRYYPAV